MILIPGIDNQKGWYWYKGDLHLHTIYSDGRWSPCELLRLAKDRGLDFLAITDHNNVQAYGDVASCGTDLPLVIPGVELGKDGGHAVALRLRELVYYEEIPEAWDMKAAAAAVNRAGGIFYIAHPYTQEPGCKWEHPFLLEECDALEIWNGEPWIEDGNDQALATWHKWLNTGRRLPGVAGSDAHKIEHWRPGTAFNYVYAPELSQEAILTNILAGHLFLSSGPWLWLEAYSQGDGGWTSVGDSLPAGRPVTLRVTWKQAPPGSTLDVRHNGVIFQWREASPAGQLLFEDMPLTPGWYTAEIWAADGNLLATTNPIYLTELNGRKDFP